MAKNTSFPPIKDGVKADNTTYSSNKIEEMISTVESEIPTLPEPAVGDIDKVIGITSDGSTGAEYGLITIENELPAPSSSNAGKIAKVVSDGEGGYEWSAADESTELPVPEVADIGKIAGVVSDGASGAKYGLVTPAKEILIIEATETTIDSDNIAKINEFFANPDKYFAYAKITSGSFSSVYPYYAPLAIGAGSSQYYIVLQGFTLVPLSNDYYALSIQAQSYGTSGAMVVVPKKLT